MGPTSAPVNVGIARGAGARGKGLIEELVGEGVDGARMPKIETHPVGRVDGAIRLAADAARGGRGL